MNPGRNDNVLRSPAGAARGEVRMVVCDPTRLGVLMTLAGLSKRELALRAGWSSHTYLLRVLRGEVRSVRADVAVRIAEAVGAGVDDLFVPEVTTDSGRGDQGGVRA